MICVRLEEGKTRTCKQNRVTYQSCGSMGPEPLPHPSSLEGGRDTEQERSRRLGTAEYLAPEICSGSTNIYFTVLS